MLTTMLLHIALSSAPGFVERDARRPGPAGPQAGGPTPEMLDRVFSRLDADGDGTISRDEFHAGMPEVLQRIRQRDGRGPAPDRAGQRKLAPRAPGARPDGDGAKGENRPRFRRPHAPAPPRGPRAPRAPLGGPSPDQPNPPNRT